MKQDENEKFVWVWDKGFEKIPIESRPLYYLDVKSEEESPSQILSKIDGEIQRILSQKHEELPMIRIRVKGKLASGFKPADLVFTNDYDAIVSFNKRLEGGVLDRLEMGDIDIDELAVKTLDKVLKEKKLNIDAARLYSQLLRGDEPAIWNLLEGTL